jgi:hypothetical protein
VAELCEAVRVFAKDISQHAREGEDPMAVWDGKADFVANESGGVDCTPLMATGATSPTLAGKRKQVAVIAVGALHAEKAAGEVAAAQTVAEGIFAGSIQRAEMLGVLIIVVHSERFE